MKQVDVLVVVDAQSAVVHGLQDNVYLIDTNKYMGSWSEGQCELTTACQDTSIVKWRVASVDPDSDVSITNFTGQIISENVCAPKKRVLSRTTSGKVL